MRDMHFSPGIRLKTKMDFMYFYLNERQRRYELSLGSDFTYDPVHTTAREVTAFRFFRGNVSAGNRGGI
jgi:hypothetical protein